MTDRTTQQMLTDNVAYLSRRLNREFYIQGQGLGNGRGYHLFEQRWLGASGTHQVTGRLLEAKEMRYFLEGMITCIDLYPTAGV